ncbi:MAG: prepilin-type N-terminal cleavage/methylation domain-containing protein [Acidobacteria bacterium]|nr:prepilin-type N-terminal cleavage/methylation domain-containing protein [Acidobacteriota bacterium]
MGFSLIETMFAIAILGIGVMSLVTLIPYATQNDYRSRIDTTATFVATRELEQILAQPFQLVPNFTDAGDGFTGTPGGGYCLNPQTGGRCRVIVTCTPLPCSAGANVDGNGNIDFSQAPGAVPAGFRRDYTIAQSAAANNPKVNFGVYDVRWRISINANGVRSVVLAARPKGNWPGTTTFPANLRVVQMK